MLESYGDVKIETAGIINKQIGGFVNFLFRYFENTI